MGPARAKFLRTNTNDIMARTFEPIRWVVPGYISEGFLVLAGRQKLGKTWLAIDMALAVATGGAAIGSIMCEQGDVLYIDMENGPRRIQSRINTLFPDERNRPDLSRLEWVTEAPQLDAGFVNELERWRQSVSEPRFAIIDVLQRIKPARQHGAQRLRERLQHVGTAPALGDVERHCGAGAAPYQEGRGGRSA